MYQSGEAVLNRNLKLWHLNAKENLGEFQVFLNQVHTVIAQEGKHNSHTHFFYSYTIKYVSVHFEHRPPPQRVENKNWKLSLLISTVLSYLDFSSLSLIISL